MRQMIKMRIRLMDHKNTQFKKIRKREKMQNKTGMKMF